MRAFLRVVLTLVLLAVIAVVVFGWWNGRSLREVLDRNETPAATTGTIDPEKARQRGAELGEKTALATAKVQEALTEASLTAKIKAKMALDDTVKARSIDVTTEGSTVTVSGTVRSDAEHDRVVMLARETDGVTRVIDRLQVRK